MRASRIALLHCLLFQLSINSCFHIFLSCVVPIIWYQSIGFLGPWQQKKIEGRIDMVEEQLVGIHGEMASLKGELQQLGPLEVKVDSLLEKLT